MREGEPGFEEKYFDMLKAGGSKHHKELLAPFGLDASDPKFWDKGLSHDRRLHRRAGGDGGLRFYPSTLALTSKPLQ